MCSQLTTQPLVIIDHISDLEIKPSFSSLHGVDAQHKMLRTIMAIDGVSEVTKDDDTFYIYLNKKGASSITTRSLIWCAVREAINPYPSRSETA